MPCAINSRRNMCRVWPPKCGCVRSCDRYGLSLLEMLAVVSILAVLATIVVGGYSGADQEARKEACYVNKGDIEIQARLWFRDNSSWPANNLSDIGANTQFFPGGLPTCPVDGSAYVLDPTTHLVVGHTH